MVNYVLLALLISFLIQIFFFAIAASLKTDKVTDLSYGLTFIIISLYFLFTNQLSLPNILVATMVIMWGLRLATYLFIRILKTKTDKRFDGIRENFLKFAQFWILQGLSIWVISLPTVYFLNQDNNITNFVTYIGFFVWAIGLIIETIADYQKFTFTNKNKGKWISTGLWKYSRHPNYLGELFVWWGIFLYVFPSLSELGFLTILGPIFITILLLFVSGIPILERKADKKYGKNNEYLSYKKKTGILFPKLSKP